MRKLVVGTFVTLDGRDGGFQHGGWLVPASTYSYPAALRVEALARAAGVELGWQPFLLGPISRAQGWTDSPFNIYPAKGRYMWRDAERAQSLGIFGAPTLAVGSELFWGNDRVEAAIAWAAGKRPAASQASA